MSLHVYPTNDLFEHDTETGEKFMEPLVIHNAADGRELKE